MRGYFGIGIDGVSKAGNIGNLLRTAHGFGAGFAFALAPAMTKARDARAFEDYADTANAPQNMPFYVCDTVADIPRPEGCRFVGIEITDDAVELPSFRHPTKAVYFLGGERLGLSDAVKETCDDFITIPTKFSLNVATAGAIVMYDRLRLLGGFADRPLMPGQKPAPRPEHVHGGRFSRKARAKARNEDQG